MNLKAEPSRRLFETYQPVEINISHLSYSEIAKKLNSLAIIGDKVSKRSVVAELGKKFYIVAVLKRGDADVETILEQRCKDSNGDVIITAGSWSAETVKELLCL